MAENQNAADQASTLNDERATRLAKRASLFEAGQNPYPEHSEIEDYVADIEAKYAELADGEDTEDVVKIGGRVVAKRGGQDHVRRRPRCDRRDPAVLPHQRYG